MLRSWLWANRKDLGFVVLFWFILSTAYLIKEWPSVSALELGDNDNYMRYVQFTSWIEFGNWYLEPMPDFNPQDGVIMHWSRLPDIPLAAISLLMMQFVDTATAYSLAISLVPLIYLLFLAILSFAYCGHYLGTEQRFVATLFIILSPIINKFLPGSIDHHNVQLLSVVAFLLVSPITKQHFQQTWRAYLQGLIVALSLWTGLENFILWVLYLACYTLHAIWFDSTRISHLKRLCFSVFGLGLILMLMNRPLVEFTHPRYDAISLPFILSFFGGGILLLAYEKTVSSYTSEIKRVLFAGLIALPIFGVIVLLYPELIKGAYADYPPLLQEFWLSNVSEARSMLTWITLHGFFSIENYFFYFIPALCYSFISNKTTELTLLYWLLILSLAIAALWQIRAIDLCFVLSGPLQAYVIYQWFSKVKLEALKAIVLIAATPLVSVFLIGSLFPKPSKLTKQVNELTPLIELLADYQVSDKLLLTGIETGTKVLALSDNKIVAAPYHRNIQGNSFMIESFLETDMDKVLHSLKEQNVGYILINRDKQLHFIEKGASDGALLLRLKSGNGPKWAELINNESEDDYQLFKIKEV